MHVRVPIFRSLLHAWSTIGIHPDGPPSCSCTMADQSMSRDLLSAGYAWPGVDHTQKSWLCMQTAGMPPQYSKSWVEVLNKAGFSVCGIDQQGCGFSEGLECYVERFHYYVDDVLQFAR